MARMTRALISTDALRHNLSQVRRLAPDSQVMAVVKANAYGHGMRIAADALADADSFAVATVEEAQRLASLGVAKPIVLLEGVTTREELDYCVGAGHELVIHHHHQVELLRNLNGHGEVRVWLKAESGMHRLGMPEKDFAEAHAMLSAHPSVSQPIGLMTHFARADEPNSEMTARQITRFGALTETFDGPKTLCNSAGILAWPQAHSDWVRAGIMLYGASPFSDRDGADLGLKPAMTLVSELVAINQVDQGESVGYGATFTAPEEMPVGIAAIGYGDGYPLHLPNGTPVLVNGVECPLAGRVSMDMISIDLRPLSSASIGDPVVLWGEGLPVERIAQHAGTLAYELMCGVTRRVKLKAV